MPRLTKEQLTARGFRRNEIEIPDTGGGTLLIRELSATETREFRARMQSLKEGDADAQLGLTAEIVGAGVIGDDGAPLFAADEIPGLPSLLGESTLAFLAQAIATLAGMRPAAEAAELEKKDAGS